MHKKRILISITLFITLKISLAQVESSTTTESSSTTIYSSSTTTTVVSTTTTVGSTTTTVGSTTITVVSTTITVVSTTTTVGSTTTTVGSTTTNAVPSTTSNDRKTITSESLATTTQLYNKNLILKLDRVYSDNFLDRSSSDYNTLFKEIDEYMKKTLRNYITIVIKSLSKGSIIVDMIISLSQDESIDSIITKINKAKDTNNSLNIISFTSTVDQSTLLSMFSTTSTVSTYSSTITSTVSSRTISSTNLMTTTLSKTTTITLAQPSVQYALNLTMNLQYSSELNNKESQVYKDYEEKSMKFLTASMIEIPGFDGCEIKGFRQGSIIVDSRINFKQTQQPQTTQLQSLILTNVAQKAQSFPELNIDTSKIQIAVTVTAQNFTKRLLMTLDQTFKDTLKDTTSNDFKTLTNQIKSFIKTALNTYYVDILINSFTSGSIIVDSTLTLNKDVSKDSAIQALNNAKAASNSLNIVSFDVDPSSTSSSSTDSLWWVPLVIVIPIGVLLLISLSLLSLYLYKKLKKTNKKDLELSNTNSENLSQKQYVDFDSKPDYKINQSDYIDQKETVSKIEEKNTKLISDSEIDDNSSNLSNSELSDSGSAII